MKALLRLAQRLHLRWLASAVLLLAAWAGVSLVVLDTFTSYSHIGNELGLVAILVFAGWSWIWADRRRHSHPGFDPVDDCER